MEVYRADNRKLVTKRSIDIEFQETVVTTPGLHKYYIVIYCKGSSTIFRSNTYELGRPEQYTNPVDLGGIALK
jgi:hypothetical protein